MEVNADLIQAILAMNCFIMLLSHFSFLAMAQKDTFSRIPLMTTCIAATAYLGMALGVMVVDVNGKKIYCLRYIDWFFTTPLILLDLALMRGADMKSTILLIVFDELMLIFGLASALSPPSAGRWPLFMLSILAFVLVIVKLIYNMNKAGEERGGDAEGKFKFVAARTMEIWCAYPVLFALCECTSTISVELEIAGYAITDVMAKCGIPMMVLVWSITERKSMTLPTLLTAEKSSGSD